MKSCIYSEKLMVWCTTWVMMHCKRCAMHRGLELRPHTYSPIPNHVFPLAQPLSSLSTITPCHCLFLSRRLCFPSFYTKGGERTYTRGAIYSSRKGKWIANAVSFLFVHCSFTSIHSLSSSTNNSTSVLPTFIFLSFVSSVCVYLLYVPFFCAKLLWSQEQPHTPGWWPLWGEGKRKVRTWW